MIIRVNVTTAPDFSAPAVTHACDSCRERLHLHCQIGNRGMQGNCTDAKEPQFEVEGAPLVPRKPGQCVILADTDLLTPGAGRLWVHNLYIRHKASQRGDHVMLMFIAKNMYGQLWMTSCTLQGTGQYVGTAGAYGLYTHGQAYVEGAVDCGTAESTSHLWHLHRCIIRWTWYA